jgi:hypothetical protein
MLPVDASPTYVMDTNNGWRVSQHFPMMTRNTLTAPPATLMEYLMAQKEHISQYYTQIDFLSIPIKIYELLNRIPVIRYLPLRVTLIFANKNHALNTLKMGLLLRNNLILP